MIVKVLSTLDVSYLSAGIFINENLSVNCFFLLPMDSYCSIIYYLKALQQMW